jgi:hypothetical protein
MEIKNPIQIIYAPGTFGNCIRWMLDRFSKDSNFKNIDSPWDKDNRVHGFREEMYNKKFIRGFQLDNTEDDSICLPRIDPMADKVVVSFKMIDLIFAERCCYYRVPYMEDNHKRYTSIISRADQSFVKESFGIVSSNKNVAKELYKIQFHDMKNHLWWQAMEKMISEPTHHKFDLYSMWDSDLLVNELTRVSKKYNLELNIEEKVIHNVVEKVKNTYPVITKDRAHQVLDAVLTKKNMKVDSLDIVEQAYIETELEKTHDCVIFPYGSNWFDDTDQINEFLDTYPAYLKHMNPRLPWYNNIKNPFYLTGRVDKSK